MCSHIPYIPYIRRLVSLAGVSPRNLRYWMSQAKEHPLSVALDGRLRDFPDRGAVAPGLRTHEHTYI